MSKAKRLIDLMITINAKRHFTARELAEEFSVSRRTILRDLQALEQAGLPLYSETGATGGYHILKERVLPPIAFSESEAMAIFFACQSLTYYRDLPFKEETDSALKKFLNCLPPDLQHRIMQLQNKVVFWTPDRHCGSPLLKALFEAVTENRAVIIRYASARSDSVRTILPIGLYAMNGLWYCPAYCTKSNSIREFRVDRMKEIKAGGNLTQKQYCHKKVLCPASIHAYLDRLELGDDYHIRVKLTREGVKRCESEFLLARGLHVAPGGGGWIELEISESTLEWTAEYLLSLGSHAVVLAPGELVDLMKQKIKELQELYCGPVLTPSIS